MSGQPVESSQALQVVQTHPFTDVGPVTQSRDHHLTRAPIGCHAGGFDIGLRVDLPDAKKSHCAGRSTTSATAAIRSARW